MEATELLNYFKQKNDIILRSVAQGKEDKRNHLCYNCVYSHFVSDSRVFCTWANHCVREDKGVK